MTPTAADNAELDYDGTGYAKANSTMGTVTTNTDLVTAAAVRTEMDSNSTQLADIVADTNELQADDVPGLIAALNDPTVGEISDGVWDEAKAGHTAGGTFGEEVQDHALSSEVAALNDVSTAEVNAEVDTALTDIHLDHLLATTYDPASKTRRGRRPPK